MNRSDKVETEFWQLIHPILKALAKSRFHSQHYATALEAAFKQLSVEVKAIYVGEANQEEDRHPLMQSAFSQDNPVIKLAPLSDVTDYDIQQAYMEIFAGSILAIRNPKAHNSLSPSREKPFICYCLLAHSL